MKAGQVIALCVICTVAGAQLSSGPVGLGTGTPVGMGSPIGGSQLATPFKAIQYKNIAQGNDSRITAARTDVINNSVAWQQFYSQMAGDQKQGFTPAPSLCDFGKFDLLVVHIGQQRSSGFSVYANMVRNERGSEVAVDLVINQPSRNSQVTQGLYSPYVVIVVEKQSVPYKFRSTFSYTTTTNIGGPAPCGCRCGCPYCAGGHNNDNYGGGQRGNTNNPFGGEICPPVQRGGRNGE
ncbi:MAG: protease complex subunit PrcB family protein [Fimbriimonadaceae bacterium]